ncbi:MAG: CBS domain-containing protein [Enhydrobacter sp.]|nr:MAG: CBS domain-containing protein [Enhydrobacter sp.]
MTIKAEASVYDAAQILLNSGISAAPVVDADHRMIGIVSEADLMYRPEIGTFPTKSWLQRLLTADESRRARDYIRSHAHRVADVMSRDVVSASEHADLQEIAELMQERGIKRIPIVRDGRLVGIVSRANLLQGLMARESSVGAAAIDDQAIQTAVSRAIATQGWASCQAPKVVVEKGTVHLWGTAPSEPIRDAIRIAAEAVRGTRRVHNHMIVRPVAPA